MAVRNIIRGLESNPVCLRCFTEGAVKGDSITDRQERHVGRYMIKVETQGGKKEDDGKRKFSSPIITPVVSFNKRQL